MNQQNAAMKSIEIAGLDDLNLDLSAPAVSPVQTNPAQVNQPAPTQTPQAVPGGQESIISATVGASNGGVVDLNADKNKRKSLLKGYSEQQIEQMASQGVQKLWAIKAEMKQDFIERDYIIDDMIRALAIGAHLLMLGPPGTARVA